MAMRELVTGGAACAVPGSSSSSNPLGALANALIGSSSKTQVLSISLCVYQSMYNQTIIWKLFKNVMLMIIQLFLVCDLVSACSQACNLEIVSAGYFFSLKE